MEEPTKRPVVPFQSTRSISQQMQQRSTAQTNADQVPNAGLELADVSQANSPKEIHVQEQAFEKPKQSTQTQQGLNEETKAVEADQEHELKPKAQEDKSLVENGQQIVNDEPPKGLNDNPNAKIAPNPIDEKPKQ